MSAAPPDSSRLESMLDVIYVLATLGFFAAMLAYVRGCEALGRDDTFAAEAPHGR